MRYYFFKCGSGNNRAKTWLPETLQVGGDTRLAIFFGTATIEECLAGQHGKDARDFCLAGEPTNWAQIRIVIVAHGRFYLLQPCGHVTIGATETGEDGKPDITKWLPVRLLVRRTIAEIPHLLASMGSNAYWIRGTFRPVGGEAPAGAFSPTRWEHQLAIEAVLKAPSFVDANLLPKNIRENPAYLLCCLSSVELETLVAKCFEEAGCFVPAYRGGVMADVDITAVNDEAKPCQIGNLTLAPKQSLNIQVKSWMENPPAPDSNGLLVSLNLAQKHIGQHGWSAKELWLAVQGLPKTKAWLRRSLLWVPAEILPTCPV